MDYYYHLAILICLYLIFAQGYNLTLGLGGLFNLAHVAAYALGAYTTAILSTDYQIGFFACLAASALCAGLLAFLIGAIALRLTQDYFAIGSLAFSFVVSALLINWKELTNGVLGIPGIPRPELASIDFYENYNFLILIAVAAFISQLFFYWLFKSSFARSLRAAAEFDWACNSLGKDTALLTNVAFLIASAFAGIAGSFFAYYINYIDPSSFSLSEMVFVLTIVIVGKPGSFWGCIASCIFLVLLPEPLRFIDINPSILGPMRQLLYALVLFAVIWIQRENIFPVRRRV